MAVPILLIAAFAITAALAAYTIMQAKKASKADQMSPSTFDQFEPTRTQEGLAIAKIFGKVMIAGNIIWYGNFESQPIYEKTSGGSGGKGFGGGKKKRSVTGYEYYIDAWFALCEGKITLEKTYIQRKEETLADWCDDIQFNDGTNGVYPTEPGEKTSPLEGLAHIFLKRFYLGHDSLILPQIHFVVKRILPESPSALYALTNANLPNGSNPAAAILDLFQDAGIQSNKIYFPAFQAAADFWEAKGYGINLKIEEIGSVADHVNKVLAYVDGIYFGTLDGRYGILAFDPDGPIVATLTQDDFKMISSRRSSYDQLANDFRGTYIDEEQDYTDRTVVAQNQAVIELVGLTSTRTIDLHAFTDRNIASKRLNEIKNENSYPDLQINLELSLKYSTLLPGQIIQVDYEPLEISAQKFRVMDVSRDKIDQGITKVSARQLSESQWIPTQYQVSGGSDFVPIATTLTPFTHYRVFEMPWNSVYESTPAYLLLIARETGYETGATILFSFESGSGFEEVFFLEHFSQRGTLDSGYAGDGTTIDDSPGGLVYTPSAFDPGFNSITRIALFETARFAIVGNEMIAFQTIEPIGGGSYRLTGLIRGVLNTPVSSHAIGSEIWLVRPGENVLSGIDTKNFYLKFSPVFADTEYTGALTAIAVASSGKALIPRRVARLTATRSGSNVTLEIFPCIAGMGFGNGAPSDLVAAENSYTTGDYLIEWNSTSVYDTSLTRVISRSGAFSISVRHRMASRLGDALAIAVGAADGVYYSW